MATYGGFPQCAGSSIGAHRHICAFFNSLDEEHRVLGSFYKDGFDRGEKATHIVAAENRGEYLKRQLVGHHMDWLFHDQPAVKNLAEHEARLNDLLSEYDDPVVCNYDSSKFGASVALDIMRTHPLVIIGGLLRGNPFFVPAEQFLDEIRERRSLRTAS